MPAEVRSDAQLEIGHVLFMDVVGYSKLLVDEQSEISHRLNRMVKNTEAFRAAEIAGKLLRLPTGDGMVLVFFDSPEAPVRCAVEISKELSGTADFGLRMGIHIGPVNRISDVNEGSNAAGGGINFAQRVMDCGDRGHILLSKRAAEDLVQYRQWAPLLHDLGEFEVKHGVNVSIVNLCSDQFGNPQLPAKLKAEAQRHVVTRRNRMLIAALLLLGLGWLAGWFVFLRPMSPAPQANLAAISEKSIAILPFKPLTGGTGDDALELGMADALIAKLSPSRELVIPSLGSVSRYLGGDPVAVGRALRVHSVLEGNVQKLGDRIRVIARLIKVADGSALWAGTFDEKFTDVFEVQDAIAQKVAAALALRLSEEEKKRLTKRYTENTEAYQLYLKGRFSWNKYTDEGFRKSIEYFKEAVEKDPNYALAYSGLADSYSLLGEMGLVPPHEVFPQGRGYAEKALALDETLAPAHVSLGIVKLFYDWNFAGAEKDLRRAKDLNPNNPDAYHFYGHYLELVGQFEDAIIETKRGVELDPTSLVINTELGLAYYFARQYDQVITQLRKTLELDPTFSYASYTLATAYAQKGAYQEELAELNRARPISAEWAYIINELGYLHAALGRQSEALAIVEQLNERRAREYIDPVLIAYVHAALGDRDQAFAWLETAFQERSGLMCWIEIEPKFDPLRADPRFADLLRRMGLK